MDLCGKASVDLRGKAFAIIGASNNPDKYGYKVVAALKKISARVFPINPKETQILGLKVFKKVAAINITLDYLVFVTPPAVSLMVLDELKLFSFKSACFWFQPGSFDGKVLDFCRNKGVNFVSDKCIIVESEKSD